jgi:hypothetical protein
MNTEEKELREKIKLIARNYGEALQAIETMLGMSATLTLFAAVNATVIKKTSTELYAMAITASYMIAASGDRSRIEGFSRLNLGKIENIDDKLDLVLNYLNEVREDRLKTKV